MARTTATATATTSAGTAAWRATATTHACLRRARLQRALLACTLLAQGTPMLRGRRVRPHPGGNNNAYRQDNATSWLDWPAPTPSWPSSAPMCSRCAARCSPSRRTGTAACLTRAAAARPGLAGARWPRARGRGLAQPGAARAGLPDRLPWRARAPLLLLVNAAQDAQRFVLPSGVWRTLLDSAAARPQPLARPGRHGPRTARAQPATAGAAGA